MTRFYFVAVWFLSLGILCQSYAQDLPYAEAVPFIGIEESAKDLKMAVCAVQIPKNQLNEHEKDAWICLGTGFLVIGKRSNVLAVTCRHVIEVSPKDKKQLFIGLDTELGYRRFLCKIVFIDPVYDIAILAPQRNTKDDIKLQAKVFPANLFDDGSSLIEGRGVLITGYPLSLGIENDENHPVIRFGIIAQFTGKDYFLLDGLASHGNSGSPVFALKHKNNRLIGMITSHIPDNINLYNENGQLSARLPYNSGLARGIVIKVIMSAIQKAEY